MTSIVQSTYSEGPVQPDGRRPIAERHVDDLGRPLTFSYLCTDVMNPQAIMEARAARLNADFAARDAESAEASQGRIPWSKLEFRDALGQQTEVAMDAFFASYQARIDLTDAQKAVIRTGYNRYQEAHYIERPLRTEVLSLLGLLKSLGLITQERIDAVVEAANG